MYIGHIESTPQNMAEIKDSEYAKHCPRALKSELEDYAASVTFSNENIPQEVSAISAKR